MALATATALAAPSGDTIEAQVIGRLKKSPDGELRISAGRITWVVDPSASPSLSEAADALDGRRVLVRGTYRRQGGGSGMRGVLVAGKLGPVEGARDDVIEVKVRGTLRAGVMAIGGETTGITITADGIVWEVEARGERLKAARDLDGRNVTLSGTLRVQSGVERGKRMIVVARRIDAKDGQ